MAAWSNTAAQANTTAQHWRAICPLRASSREQREED